MTAEKPFPRERSPVEREREETYDEISREMAELYEWQRKALEFVNKADTLLLRVESNLPHWRKHKDEIHEQLQEVVGLLLKHPHSDKFYPMGAIDRLIDGRIKEKNRQQ